MRPFKTMILTILSAAAVSAQAPASGDDRAAVLRAIDARRDAYATVAKQIWGFAEVGYQEQKSSALLQQQLRDAGFLVKAGVADIPTAFVATFGSGKPIIGIIGEFDALPGLSQEAQTAAAVLGHNFPDSPWYKHAYSLVKSGGKEPSENKESWISKAFKKIGVG